LDRLLLGVYISVVNEIGVLFFVWIGVLLDIIVM